MDDPEIPILPPGREENAPQIVDSTPPAGRTSSPVKWVIMAAVVLILGLPVALRLFSGGDSSDAQGNQLQVSFRKYQEHKYQEAIDAARAYLKTNPGSPDAYNNIAVSFLALRNYDEATRNAVEALRLNPNYQLAKNNLAWIAEERRKAMGGAPSSALAAAPLSAAAVLLNKSLEAYNAGKFGECIDAATAAIKLDPNYAEAYNNLAACESSLNRYDQAIAAAQRALSLKPDFELARNNLAWALKQRANAK